MGALDYGIPGRFRTTDSGTKVIAARTCVLKGVTVGTSDTGQTLTIHDAATSGAVSVGTTDVSVITLDSVARWIPLPVQMHNGIVAVLSGGTCDATIVFA
jgi:hypothetical protein